MKPEIQNMLSKALAYMESETEKVNDRIAKRFQKIVQAQLDDWHERFPRHTFSALEGNGSLSFKMTPAPYGTVDNGLKGDFEYWDRNLVQRSAAHAEILDEAETINTLYCNEYKVMFGFSDSYRITSK